MACNTCSLFVSLPSESLSEQEAQNSVVDDSGTLAKAPQKTWITTNHIFYEGIPSWQLQSMSHRYLMTWLTGKLGNIPIFFKRCAISQELFDIITEFRISMPAATIAHRIERGSLQI
jgi:hypothetical protein